MRNLKITILGSGTSSGVPVVGCDCITCSSLNPKDNRLRCSIMVESETTRFIIDTGPDFRQQMLKHNIKSIDAILYTHHHNDHIAGFDDIRAFNFVQNKSIPIYVNQKTLEHLKQTFNYAFERPEQLGGGIPEIEINMIGLQKFNIGDIEIESLSLMHGNLEVYGFRIGNFAYCTDTNFIPDATMEKLKVLDLLILDALRYHKHPTHYTIEESLNIVELLQPYKTYFIHMAHQVLHDDCQEHLPKNVFLAYDGLELYFEN